MIDADALLVPVGDLDPDVLWPGDTESDVISRLSAYITDGYTQAASITDSAQRDAAVKAWAYYRAYSGLYVQLAAASSSVTLNDQLTVSSSTSAQLDAIAGLRAEWLAAFQRLLADPGIGAPAVPRSQSVSKTGMW
jgi:hypothetical protein